MDLLRNKQQAEKSANICHICVKVFEANYANDRNIIKLQIVGK